MNTSTGFAALFTAFLGIGMGMVEVRAAADGDPAALGREYFNSYCFVCHGADGRGDGVLARKLELVGKVADLTQGKYADMDTTELTGRIAGYDRQQSTMPKWKEVLPDDEIRQIATYVKTLSRRYGYLNGKNIYFGTCALCHGADGGGGGATAKQLAFTESLPDLRAEKYQKMSDAELVKAIASYSASNDKVPDWAAVLDGDALRDVATYIRLNPTGLIVVGDAVHGKQVFERNCVACHGRGGKGDGVLAGLLDVKMVDYTTKAQLEMTDAALVHTISLGKGTYMPGWFGELDENEIQDVAAYVRTMMLAQ